MPAGVMPCSKIPVRVQVIDAEVGGSSATVGAAHHATVTTVDQTQIITLQACSPTLRPSVSFLCTTCPDVWSVPRW